MSKYHQFFYVFFFIPKFWVFCRIIGICYLHKFIIVSFECALDSYLSDNSNHLQLFIEEQSQQNFGVLVSITLRLNR